MEKYNYEPLDLERPAIRLLHLHPGSNNSEISCSLSQVERNQRDDTVSYEALSYTWGFPDLFEMITVDGCYLDVTYNLHMVLQQLRYPDVDRILWIDAICIDQGNKKERGHQVEQMSKIYSEAERVIFWLGPGTVETDMLMKSLQLLQRESINYNFGNWSLQDDRWKNLWASMGPTFESFHKEYRTLQCQGLRELLSRPWFRRVWILQEVALAKAGIIICGRKHVPARLFSLIPVLLEMKIHSHCQSVLDIMPSPWRKTSWWSKSPNLRTLLLYFGDSEATESRDLVYALRGMSSDAVAKNGILPNYEQTEKDLVHEVVRFVEHGELGDPMFAFFLPLTIRDLIKDLRALDLHCCTTLAEQSAAYDMEIFLSKRPEFKILERIVIAAAASDKTGETIEVLMKYREKEFTTSKDILMAAANNPTGAKGVFEALFRYQKDRITISASVFEAAISNVRYGDELLTLILSSEHRFVFESDQLSIPVTVLKAAAANHGCGDKIINILLSHESTCGLSLIRRCIAIAAAQSIRYCDKLMKISSYIPVLAYVAEEVALFAARKKVRHDTVSVILLKIHPIIASFLEEVAQAAAMNTGCGEKVVNTFLSHNPNLAIFQDIYKRNKGIYDCNKK